MKKIEQRDDCMKDTTMWQLVSVQSKDVDNSPRNDSGR